MMNGFDPRLLYHLAGNGYQHKSTRALSHGKPIQSSTVSSPSTERKSFSIAIVLTGSRLQLQHIILNKLKTQTPPPVEMNPEAPSFEPNTSYQPLSSSCECSDCLTYNYCGDVFDHSEFPARCDFDLASGYEQRSKRTMTMDSMTRNRRISDPGPVQGPEELALDFVVPAFPGDCELVLTSPTRSLAGGQDRLRHWSEWDSNEFLIENDDCCGFVESEQSTKDTTYVEHRISMPYFDYSTCFVTDADPSITFTSSNGVLYPIIGPQGMILESSNWTEKFIYCSLDTSDEEEESEEFIMRPNIDHNAISPAYAQSALEAQAAPHACQAESPVFDPDDYPLLHSPVMVMNPEAPEFDGFQYNSDDEIYTITTDTDDIPDLISDAGSSVKTGISRSSRLRLAWQPFIMRSRRAGINEETLADAGYGEYV